MKEPHTISLENILYSTAALVYLVTVCIREKWGNAGQSGQLPVLAKLRLAKNFYYANIKI